MANFIRSYNPIWWFFDLSGLILNDEYYAFFLTNDLPYLPQSPTHDQDGLIPWSSPIQFEASGNLPVDMFFDPSLVYRIEIRHGNTQADPLIWLIENYVPGSGSGDNPNAQLFNSNNQISNPQFALVDFVGTASDPFIYAPTGGGPYVLDVAPGWILTLTGSGTTKLSQILLSGQDSSSISNPIPGNPPYALHIDNSGWSSAILSQRFNQNGAIFANGAIGASLEARPQNVNETLTINYVTSDNVIVLLATKLLPSDVFSLLAGAVNIPASTNTTTGDMAFIDIQIVLPPTGIVDITNIQVLGQEAPLSAGFVPEVDIPSYVETTIERQTSELFFNYKDSLLQQAKDNLLTGWTFGLNPYQFNDTALTTATALTSYIADQTILHQETASALQTGRGSVTDNFGLEVIAINGTDANRFALIQYIDRSTMDTYNGQIVSALVRARIFHSSGSLALPKLKIRLIYRANGSAVPAIGDNEPITGWTDGDVDFAAGWTAIEPLNDVAYTLLNQYEDPSNTGSTDFPAMAYNQFQLPIFAANGCDIGVVVYIASALNNTAALEDRVAFDRISLVPNDFAIDASPETYDSAFRKCQYYYEKSYQRGDLPGTITTVGARMVVSPWNFSVSGTGTELCRKSFNVNFMTTKISIPDITFYAPDSATINQIQLQLNLTGGTQRSMDLATTTYTPIYASPDTITMKPNTAGAVFSIPGNSSDSEGLTIFHYTADARLGT